MDKLSEYSLFEILFENKWMQNFADIYFHLVLKHTSLGYDLYIFPLFYVRALYVIAKQRIDSGFFLFQAE